MLSWLIVLAAAACSSPRYTDGALRCAATGRSCPANFFCAADDRCWTLGRGPDLGHVVESGGFDLATTPAPDLAGADLASFDLGVTSSGPADLARPDDATTIPLVQLGHVTGGNATLTAALTSPSRAGTLIVFTFAYDGAGHAADIAGWTRWSGNSTANDAEVWFMANNPGGMTTASVTFSGATTSIGQLSEWQSVTIADQATWCWDNGSVNFRNCTTSPTQYDRNLGISCFSELVASAASVNLTPGSGWLNLGNNDSAVVKLHYTFDFALALPDGVAASETKSSNLPGSWAGALVTFH